ncbi:MAG: hypothetical protein H8E21_07675 [Gammaproteobacteria bacterium]|nr:hypothetical protein [Gammaproteobacteria bacterium]MBL6999499.1 hypothetical protein [Gammaproteobacteria bacterium]
MPIKLGVYNWQSFAPDAGYYPQDLPPDWKLSYYANEFASAAIDLASGRIGIQQLQQLVDGLAQEFELTLAFSGLAQLDQWLTPLHQQPIKLHSLMLPPSALAQLLRDQTRLKPLSTLGIVHSTQLITADALWSPDKPDQHCRIALLEAHSDLKQYRRWIEQWVGDHPERCETLWLQGETANYSQLTKLRTLLELLGY